MHKCLAVSTPSQARFRMFNATWNDYIMTSEKG
jgi:hypothetical protein